MIYDSKWASAVCKIVDAHLVQVALDIVRSEGGEVNNPLDRGGFTIYGITLATARNHGLAFDYDRDGVVSIQDMRQITPDVAVAFFVQFFAITPGISRLAVPVQPIIFDMAVNSGPSRAITLLQQTLNQLWQNNPHVRGVLVRRLVEDGVIAGGVSTVNASIAVTDICGSDAVISAICDARIAFYRRIVAANPSQNVFLKGWINRVERFRPTLGS